MIFPVVGPSYQTRARAFSAERCINLIPEPAEADARGKWVLNGAPGLTQYVDLGTASPARCGIVMANVLYVVYGTTLYSIVAGVATTIGTIGGSDRLSVATNGSQIVFVSITSGGWIYDVANGLRQITDADYQPANNVTFLNQYFIFTRTNSQQFFTSDLADGSSYDILNFASAEGDPDNLVTCIADNGELWLFGQTTTEIWTNTGDPTFPLQRINGAVLSKGIAGIHAVTRLDNTVYWIGSDGVVYRANGYSPARISTFAIEQKLGELDISDAYCFSYVQEGHSYFCMTVGSYTFVYDAATQLWHERSSRVHNSMDQEWRVNGIIQFGSDLIALDNSDGILGIVDPDAYEEYGTEIVWQRITSMISNEGKPLVCDSMQLICETGVGPSDGTDPQVSLSTSEDNGHSFGNEKFRSMGQIGEYGTRVIFRRLGRFYQKVFKLQGTMQARLALIDCAVEVSSA